MKNRCCVSAKKNGKWANKLFQNEFDEWSDADLNELDPLPGAVNEKFVTFKRALIMMGDGLCSGEWAKA